MKFFAAITSTLMLSLSLVSCQEAATKKRTPQVLTTPGGPDATGATTDGGQIPGAQTSECSGPPVLGEVTNQPEETGSDRVNCSESKITDEKNVKRTDWTDKERQVCKDKSSGNGCICLKGQTWDRKFYCKVIKKNL